VALEFWCTEEVRTRMAKKKKAAKKKKK